jgi:hypothetical protein
MLTILGTQDLVIPVRDGAEFQNKLMGVMFIFNLHKNKQSSREKFSKSQDDK